MPAGIPTSVAQRAEVENLGFYSLIEKIMLMEKQELEKCNRIKVPLVNEKQKVLQSLETGKLSRF